MSEQEAASVMLGDVRITDDLNAQRSLEPAGAMTPSKPEVVVSSHEGTPDAAFGQRPDGAKDGMVTSRGLRVIEPEIEEVTEDVESFARRSGSEERDQRALLGSLSGRRLAP
jgi:hypothetical protein